MRKTFNTVPVVLAVLLGSAASVMAGDFCVAFDSRTTPLVLKAFLVPPRGACRDFRGFSPSPVSFTQLWLRGTACGSSDGAVITFFQTTFSDDGSFISTDKYRLSRETLVGTGTHCLVDTGSAGTAGSCSFGVTYEHVVCSPAVVPVPQ